MNCLIFWIETLFNTDSGANISLGAIGGMDVILADQYYSATGHKKKGTSKMLSVFFFSVNGVPLNKCHTLACLPFFAVHFIDSSVVAIIEQDLWNLGKSYNCCK